MTVNDGASCNHSRECACDNRRCNLRLATPRRLLCSEVERLRAELARLRAESMRGAVEALRAEAQRLPGEFRSVEADRLQAAADWLEKQQAASQGQPEPEREARRRLGEWLAEEEGWTWRAYWPMRDSLSDKVVVVLSNTYDAESRDVEGCGLTFAAAVTAALDSVEGRASQTAAMRGEKAEKP